MILALPSCHPVLLRHMEYNILPVSPTGKSYQNVPEYQMLISHNSSPPFQVLPSCLVSFFVIAFTKPKTNIAHILKPQRQLQIFLSKGRVFVIFQRVDL